MALTSCCECGKQVSDKAASCPGCGAPVSTAAALAAPVVVQNSSVRVTRAGWRWEAIGALLVISGVVAAIAGAGLFGGVALTAGFFIFMVGRFIN